MISIQSTVSSSISITYDDDAREDRFVVEGPLGAYVVLPQNGSATSGEFSAMAMAPAPTEKTSGTVLRFAAVFDVKLARSVAVTQGGWAFCVRVNEAPLPTSLAAVDAYYDFGRYGSSTRIDDHASDPVFVGVDDDVTEDFLASATPEQLAARAEIGQVFQRLCVDMGDERDWTRETGDGIVFCGTHAPALSGMTFRQRAGLLAEAGIADQATFARTAFRTHEQDADVAARLCANATEPFAVGNPDILDAYRLHTAHEVRLECYGEMALEARGQAMRVAAAPDVVAVPKFDASPGMRR